ncbi:MAG: alpha-L-fucosidase, partial [Oscillospiraceae bacterium]|nr:alpha-L-fucosidase [Oscillospiraceae bacterium]
VHDVILSFNDDMEIHIDWFKFSAYDGTETKAEKDARMAWWRDCHFGQFIHLGAYSHLGGIYNGSFNSGNAEWIMCDKGISKTAYAAAAAKPFNPSEFNAAEIVGMAKATGQKYIAFTSRHHEGFSMYDTKIREFKDYCLMTYGDYKGPDPLMELSKECRKQDIKFGVYFSFADWHDVSQNGWFGDSMPDLSVKDEYKTRMKGQLREIIEYYDPDLFWFDGEFPNWWTRADGNEFYRFCRTMKPSLIINDRIGKNYQGDGDYHIIEVEVPELPPAYDWEICTSPNDSWGHVSFKTYWKNAKTLVEGLVDITSKNGVMLFNIGPDGKGRIPDKPRAIFGEIGSWMDKHSEAIHGARGTYYSYLPNYIKTTTKDGRLYLHLFQFPENNTVSIPALKNEILGMKQMDGGAAISYTRRGDMLDISLDGITPDPYVTVIEIAVDGMPAVVDSAPKSAPRSADLARGAVSVTASSGSSGAANVINGINSTNSRWTAGNGTTGWVELQFAAPITANSADLRQYENHNAGSYNNYTNTFVIEYWDGSQWAAAYTGYDIEIAKRFDFTAAVTSDRFRFRVTEGLNPVLIGFGLFNVTWPE